ncbi:hypothetical protein Chor_013613 [Crotalus horridus]
MEELSRSLQLHETLQSELLKIEGQIPPIHEQFAILEKYEVAVDEEVLQLLGDLNSEWLAFQQCLLDSETMLKKHKEKFKTGLIHCADDFKKKAQNLLQDFDMNGIFYLANPRQSREVIQVFCPSPLAGPFTSAVSADAALEQIMAMRQLLATMKEEENALRSNLGIFKIDQPASKDLQKLERELDYIQQVWEITKEWEVHWEEWKNGSFKTLKTEVMENTAFALFRKLNKLSKELKASEPGGPCDGERGEKEMDRNWEIIETSKAKIEQFKRTMPLITDLRNPALRERHWDQVKDLVLRTFDQDAEDFRLENIIELGLDKHVEKVAEISSSATKELAIEQTWAVTTLDIVPYKDKGHHRIRGTEDVFQALDDNQVALSTMKASRFVKPFEKEVDRWERCLSLILEVIEMLLTVQRQWMYLENIFLGEDIRKQLPGESSSFDNINGSWKTIMDRFVKDNNALRATHYPGLLDKLVEMNTALEDIQKSLDMYLETKRHIFPRFYFLSNDDLLEILGQSRNPEAVQPHLKKCFDNIKCLKIQKAQRSRSSLDQETIGTPLEKRSSPFLPQIGASNRSEALGMFSLDGEYVDFTHSVLLEGPVEEWLCDVERAMRWTLREVLRNCRLALKKMLTKRDKWVKEWPGQMVITASQIQWTADVSKCLATCKERGDKKYLKAMKKKQISMLNKYSEAIRGSLTKIMRLKIVALVTVEVHARDVIEKLYRSSLLDVTSFEWLSQLRLYWEKLSLQDLDDCVIRQTNTQFAYGYEYLGNSGRLVITPLTDRCPAGEEGGGVGRVGGFRTPVEGPAGTGKTETVKDLGKSLGMYVIVVNCSEGLDYKSMGRMYSGLAQTGAWGCFDEFNRINIEVLSVVAQQILSILSALAANMTRFTFEGHEINLVWSCGIFITMNPGYAGRTELPDNLKSMFRPISMVVPDSTLIAEIILFGEGFNNCKILAKKVYTLYSLAVQQLSKQDHYDFGLRALTSLLRYAGKKRRVRPDLSDEEDMNIAKLTSGDVPLFNAIIQDLFPGIECPVIDYGKLKEVLEGELREMGLQTIPFTIMKVIQLFETKNSRHSSMIVGNTGSGKTVTWRALQATLCSLHRAGDAAFNLVREYPLNPKAVSLGELYGEYNLSTNEWTDGILSSVMRTACADEKPDEKWILFDGPVDTLWIESMNSVMDDNKVLTLINGERIAMPEQVSLLFEVENLAVASPATVSRCGMVYTDYSDLGWKPLTDAENYSTLVEMYYVFSMIWSLCAAVDEEGRKKIDSFLREIEGMPFYKIIVPTVDTMRYNYLVNALISNQQPVLLVGMVGTGKTSIAQEVLQSLDTMKWAVLVINMSAQTTSNNVQSIIESRVEKRTKGIYVPMGGKSMITFMDDLNMPAKDTFGSQPPLELLRLWLDYGFWYDRAKQTIKHIKDMFLMAAMGPAGGGRTVISSRLQSRFNLINMTFPTDSQIRRIFGTMINQKLQNFEEAVKPIGNVITEATVELYNSVVQRFLPTPAKIHYLFNLRDISKVFQGMLRGPQGFPRHQSQLDPSLDSRMLQGLLGPPGGQPRHGDLRGSPEREAGHLF